MWCGLATCCHPAWVSGAWNLSVGFSLRGAGGWECQGGGEGRGVSRAALEQPPLASLGAVLVVCATAAPVGRLKAGQFVATRMEGQVPGTPWGKGVRDNRPEAVTRPISCLCFYEDQQGQTLICVTPGPEQLCRHLGCLSCVFGSRTRPKARVPDGDRGL